MIQEFTIKNFLSIKEAQTISFLASKDKTDRELHIISPIDPKGPELLKIAVIYGANASGKSNILSALKFFVNFMLNSFGIYKPQEELEIEPFIFANQTKEETSEFSFTFYINQIKYKYDLALDKHGVVSEKLSSWPKKQIKLIYERTIIKQDIEREYKYNTGSSLSGAIQTIAESTRQNASFLSTAAQFKQAELAPIQDTLVNMTSGLFWTQIKLMELSIKELKKSEEFKKLTIDILRCADFSNIIDIKIEEIKIPQSDLQIIENIMNIIPPSYSQMFGKTPDSLDNVLIKHNYNPSAQLLLGNESAGTKKLLMLAFPLIKLVQSQYFFAYDEIENSLHYDLLRFFIESFLANSSSSQILFTTHNLDLLEAGFLRDDEIWFAEKDETGASHFNRISDYTGVRKGVSRKSMYEAGKFGAKPIMSPMTIFKSTNEHIDGNT